MEDCYKIDMGCECYPLPPDRPLPFVFPAFNLSALNNNIGFSHHMTNPGKVGISNPLASIPVYTNYTYSGCNFGHSVTITIDPPPGFPGPGLVQATATMTVAANGNPTITMTNVGAGYVTTSNYAVGFTLTDFNIINIKAGTNSYMQFPVANLAGSLPNWPNLTLTSAKIIPQLCGTVEFNAAGGLPFILRGKWYKNGVQIGDTMQLQITSEGKKKIVHYCPPETFLYADGLSYQLTSSLDNMIDFTGDVLYYVQYT